MIVCVCVCVLSLHKPQVLFTVRQPGSVLFVNNYHCRCLSNVEKVVGSLMYVRKMSPIENETILFSRNVPQTTFVQYTAEVKQTRLNFNELTRVIAYTQLQVIIPHENNSMTVFLLT